MTTTVVIGGSGTSLLRTDTRRIPSNARIVRINNFFLEKSYHLGRIVDCVYFSADPRALRLYNATLCRVVASGEYQIESVASAHPRATRLIPPAPFTPVKVRDPQIRDLIAAERQARGVLPTSGVIAAIAEVERGADHLILAGIDLYRGAQRYAYPPNGNLARVLTPNTSTSGHYDKFHSDDLDIKILSRLLDRGVKMTVGHDRPFTIGDHKLSQAQILEEDQQLPPPTTKPSGVNDWVRFSGLSSVDFLVAARWMRRHLPLPSLASRTRSGQ